jgi:hypothetical protein
VRPMLACCFAALCIVAHGLPTCICTMLARVRPARISSGTLCLLYIGTRSCSSRRTSTRVRCSTRPHCW